MTFDFGLGSVDLNSNENNFRIYRYVDFLILNMVTAIEIKVLTYIIYNLPVRLSHIVTVFTIMYGSASASGDGYGDPEDWDTKQIKTGTARLMLLDNPFKSEIKLSRQRL